MEYRAATSRAGAAVREFHADRTTRIWREYLEALADELKEELIDAEKRDETAAQIRLIRRILADVDPTSGLHRRKPTPVPDGPTG